jgi:hypothetical protein
MKFVSMETVSATISVARSSVILFSAEEDGEVELRIV